VHGSLLNYLLSFLQNENETGTDIARPELVASFIKSCLEGLGNVDSKDGVLIQMSNTNSIIYRWRSTVTPTDFVGSTARAGKERKGPPPRPVEKPCKLDPAKTTARQSQAFFTKT
jgi:hypothetical protein